MRTTHPFSSAFAALALLVSSSLGEQDTVVLNQAEFRFPETHPGKVFTVKKVMLRAPDALKKEIPAFDGANRSDATAATRELSGRDVQGRLIGDGSYRSRLARLRTRSSLPIYARHEARPSLENEKPIPLRKIPKSLSRGASRFSLTSDSPLLQSAKDLARLESEERKKARQIHGAIHPALAKKLEAAGNNDSIEILIHMKVNHPGFVDRTKASLEAQKANVRAWLDRRPVMPKSELARRHGLRDLAAEKGGESNQRVLKTKTSKASVRSLSRFPEIATIEEFLPPPEPTSLPYEDLVESAFYPDLEIYTAGSGVKTATIEYGLKPAFANCVNGALAPVHYHADGNFPAWYLGHTQATYYILASGTVGHDRYHFMYDIYGSNDETDSVLAYEISSVSQSTTGEADPTNHTQRARDLSTYFYPYPVYSMPTANNGYHLVPNWGGYNVISVGNVQHLNHSSYSVDPFWLNGYNDNTPPTQTKNPPARYGIGYGAYDDRELPLLVAPGAPSNQYQRFINGCVLDTLNAQWQGVWGTSFSAPVANAVATNLIGAGVSNPEEVRAILLATAIDVDGTYWNPYESDQKDGTGVISGIGALNFAYSAARVSPGNDPEIQGIGSGSVDSATMAGSMPHIEYNYLVPMSIPEGKHLRAVLTWTSSPGVNFYENDISDFELAIEGENFWYSSDSWNGNVEVIDIPSGDLVPGSDYKIILQPWSYREAPDGPNMFYYAVAWAWVKDHVND